jgi:hypothetical protein
VAVGVTIRSAASVSGRRHLTASQKAAVAAEALPLFEAESKERQGARVDIQAILPESERGQARDKAAGPTGGLRLARAVQPERTSRASNPAWERERCL